MGEADRRSLHGHGVEAALLLRLSEHGGDVVPRDPEVPVGGQVDEYAVDEPQRQQRHHGDEQEGRGGDGIRLPRLVAQHDE